MAEEKPKGDPVFLTIAGEKVTLPGVTSLNTDDELSAAADQWIAKNYKGPEIGAPVVFRTPLMAAEGGFAPGEEIVVQALPTRPFEKPALDVGANVIGEQVGALGFDPATMQLLAPDQGFLSQFNRAALEAAQPLVQKMEFALAAPSAALNTLTQLAYNFGIGNQNPRRTAAEIEEALNISSLAAGIGQAPSIPTARQLVRETPFTPSMAAIAEPTPEIPVVPTTLRRPQAVELPEPAAITAEIPEAAVAPKLKVPPAPKITEAEGRAALLNLEKKDLTNPTTKLPVTKKVADFAADYLTTTGLEWDRQSPFIDFFRQHYNADTLPPETVQELHKKYDIQELDWMEIMTGVRQTVGDAGRTLALLRTAANKIPQNAADLAQKFNKELPPPSLWARGGNAIRGSLIAEVAKVTRDLASSGINVGLDVFTNVMDNALNQVLLNPVRSVMNKPVKDINYGDAFVLFSQSLGPSLGKLVPKKARDIFPGGLGEARRQQTTNLLDQLERNAPKISREFLDTYSADNVRPALTDRFSKVEKAVDATNFLGRWSDGMVRKAVFPAFLRRSATRAGFNFDEMVANKTIHTLPEEVTAKALNDTADFTFSRKAQKDGPMFLGKTSKKVIDLINNQGGPVGAVTIGFPGFIANALNFQYRYGPGILGALTKAGREKVMQGDTKVLSEGIAGMTLLYAAMQFQDSEYAGSKWYTVRMPDGTEKDLRPIFPAPYFLLLADLIKRFNDGTIDLAYTSADILQGLTGAQFRAGAGLYVADELIRDLTRAGKLGDKAMDAIKKTLGSAIGGLLPYGSTAKDIVGSVEQAVSDNPQEAIVRDTSEAPFLGAALREVPFAQTRLLNLPEQEYAAKEGPAQTVDPLLRQLTGLATSKPANVIEREMRSLGLDERDLYQKEGFPALDRRQRQLMGYLAEYNANDYFNSPEYRNADKLRQTEMFREFYKGIRGAARDVVKNENESFASLIWYNDQSREDKIRLDNEYEKSVGKSFREFYTQLLEAPVPANKAEFDALPKGTKYTDPGDYKVYTKGE
jgi:hypothetical protein